MYIAIQHHISNPSKFERAAKEIGERIPTGIKALSFLPNKDYSMANCLWEAESLDKVREFVESEVGDCSKNDYYVVDVKTAMGLPE